MRPLPKSHSAAASPLAAAPSPSIGVTGARATYPTAAEARWPYPMRTVAEADADRANERRLADEQFLTRCFGA